MHLAVMQAPLHQVGLKLILLLYQLLIIIPVYRLAIIQIQVIQQIMVVYVHQMDMYIFTMVHHGFNR
ncbi:hypothetical protein EBU99_15190 [bacterium]|nr:hypothetical protein [bacterium]